MPENRVSRRFNATCAETTQLPIFHALVRSRPVSGPFWGIREYPAHFTTTQTTQTTHRPFAHTAKNRVSLRSDAFCTETEQILIFHTLSRCRAVSGQFWGIWNIWCVLQRHRRHKNDTNSTNSTKQHTARMPARPETAFPCVLPHFVPKPNKYSSSILSRVLGAFPAVFRASQQNTCHRA